ncbi:MAG TPA: thioredoxin family protein [Campylobacterales bacterium]|nr:thioredoxin family protein [Campylobacterales bacterium]HHS92737.1 thioredoxin family protein [Campylobacterales bacterium]
MKLLLIFSFLFGSLFVFKENAFDAEEKMTYEKAVALSKETNKMIMLKLTADNCKYCVKMDKEVLANDEVKGLLENFITVTLNVDQEEALPLGLKRTITPTFVFVNKEEEIVSKLPGSWNQKDFVDLLNNRL